MRIGSAHAEDERMSNQDKPIFALDKPEYIAALLTWGRRTLLHELHRCGVKMGKVRRTDAELAELIWYATAPTRERNRAKWEHDHADDHAE